jgi:hypothetical protein
MGRDIPGENLFHGPLLQTAWNHCIGMFVRSEWLEVDVRKYLDQLCINDFTILKFIKNCHNKVYLQAVQDKKEKFTEEQTAITLKDYNVFPQKYELPVPPAMWQLGYTEDKTEGIMHLSMGIQKAVFKFVIQWATENWLGSTLQRRLGVNLAAVQELKVAFCPCRPYKDDKFGGFTAEGYRAMTLTSPFIYRSLLESNLETLPPRAESTKDQKEWSRQDNVNWMYLRGIEHSPDILALEAKEQVRREMQKSIPHEIVNNFPQINHNRRDPCPGMEDVQHVPRYFLHGY